MRHQTGALLHHKNTGKAQHDDAAERGEAEHQPEHTADPAAAKLSQGRRGFEFATDAQAGLVKGIHALVVSGIAGHGKTGRAFRA
jgi:hypothetical protein